MMVNYLPHLYEDAVTSRPPGNRMGIGGFSDIPVPPLGASWDSCLRFVQPLTESAADFRDGASSLRQRDSGTVAGCQLFTLQFSNDGALEWRPNNFVEPDGRPLVKVVLLVTNRAFHVAGDAARLAPRAGFRPNTGDLQCRAGGEDYPSFAQVLSAIDTQNAFLAIVATEEVAPLYEELVRATVGPERGFVARAQADMSDYVEAAKRAIGGNCVEPSDPSAVDVVYLQGLSNSVRPYLDPLKATVPHALREVQRAYTDSRFGLVGFRDRPTYPFVSSYWLYTSASWDIDALEHRLERMFIPSAIDCNEKSLDALLDLADDARAGFRETEDGRRLHRALLVITAGAPPTTPGVNMTAPRCPIGYPGLDVGPFSRHTGKEFTSYEQLASELAGIGAGATHLAFGVPDDLMGVWGDVATVMTGMGVATTVHSILDVEGMVRAAADPDGLLQ
eukprot:Polyplicarium_translucidae@DN3363_c1_g1_i12.p1